LSKYIGVKNGSTVVPVKIASNSSDSVLEAPDDGKEYARKNKDWTEITGGGGGIPDAPIDGKLYGRKDAAWDEITGGGGIPEAPDDGKLYGRKDEDWAEVTKIEDYVRE
jgi:hypothetical protein